MVLAWGSHSLSFSSAPTEKGVNNDIFMATRATTTGRKKRPEQESLRSTSRNLDAKVASSRALKKELILLASWRGRCVCSPSIRSKTTAVFVGGTVENMSYRPLSVSIFFHFRHLRRCPNTEVEVTPFARARTIASSFRPTHRLSRDGIPGGSGFQRRKPSWP